MSLPKEIQQPCKALLYVETAMEILFLTDDLALNDFSLRFVFSILPCLNKYSKAVMLSYNFQLLNSLLILFSYLQVLMWFACPTQI
jgi:hypothetical protein